MVQITKTSFLELFSKGLSVEEMATELSTSTGARFSPADVRSIAKGFDVNLRNKPRKAKFTLVDDTVNSTTVNSEGYVNTSKTALIAE